MRHAIAEPWSVTDGTLPVEVLVVGSNLDRERSIARVLTLLLDLADPVRTSRIMETPAEGLLDRGPSFYNMAVALPWAAPTAALKSRLVAIEEATGRDRQDASRSKVSRTADIDPVLRLEPPYGPVSGWRLPSEPYARAVVLDLLAALGVGVHDPEGSGRPTPAFGIVEIPWGTSRLGSTAAVVTRAAWQQSA